MFFVQDARSEVWAGSVGPPRQTSHNQVSRCNQNEQKGCVTCSRRGLSPGGPGETSGAGETGRQGWAEAQSGTGL